jgi:ADP-ribose pyrophosphatase YjhB (NUDIX family)
MALHGIDDYPERYRYRFCPMDTTPLVRCRLHGMERPTCPRCGRVFHPRHCVAATIIVEYQGAFPLAQRALLPDAGMWHLPIGHVEFGEHSAAAAARQAQEETGPVVAVVEFLTYEHSPGYGDPLLWYVVSGFVGGAVGGALATSEETSALWVVPPDELPELKWTSQRKTVEAYRRRAGSG